MKIKINHNYGMNPRTEIANKDERFSKQIVTYEGSDPRINRRRTGFVRSIGFVGFVKLGFCAVLLLIGILGSIQ
ncbi:MAG TPA: hypothetical protein PLE33_05995 [Candidatus Cloacimonas sp.]|nr:hypothetical protein [Candidatus Cloacimonas sp.]HPS60797.1 hypothetical protein [Candidatus Cloacimonas sp.]